MIKKQEPLTETAYLILLAMLKPNHGYGVMKFVEEKTKGRVVFGPGTLYGAINNLHKKGWIEPCPTKPGERKIEYIITDEGLKRVKEELRRLKEIYEIGVEILKGRGENHDKEI
ncbi:MAG: PadR family transcriptional regulator [Tissierellia bacterium]|nr:PadR family transcriptional regulator [Tissierellia bacterium]